MWKSAKFWRRVPNPVTCTWQASNTAYGYYGQSELPVKWCRDIQLTNTLPSDHGYVAVLRACTRKLAIAEGRLVHANITQTGFQANVYVANSLIDMYCKCGSLGEAQTIFNTLPKRNVVSWTTLIAGYTYHGLFGEALDLFANMQQEGIIPNKVTFLSAIKACSSIADIHKGKKIHDQLINSGIVLDAILGSALVDMYAKCGDLYEAKAVFYNIHQKNVVCWTALIAGCVQHGYGREALSLYHKMQQEGVKPNRVTQLCALKGCGTIAALDFGRDIHGQLLTSGNPIDTILGNALVEMYVQCGSIEDAERVFDNMQAKSVVSWTAMIAGYAQSENPSEALHVFQRMEQDGLVPNKFSYANVLKACGSVAALDQGRRFHAQAIREGAERDSFVENILIDMYVKCGSLQEAKRVFVQLNERDVVAWTSIIAAFAQEGYAQESLQHFKQMQHEGVKPDKICFVSVLKACRSIEALEEGKLIHAQLNEKSLDRDVVIGSVLVDMYCNCASLEDALHVFNSLASRDVFAWNAIMGGHVLNGDSNVAQSLFQKMQEEGTDPDRVTFLILLKVCGNMAALDQGKQMHAELVARGLMSDVLIGNSLIDMYARCGLLNEAHKVFDHLEDKGLVSWNTLIAGYVHEGKGDVAINLFCQMKQEGIQPNEITFLSILKACGSITALDEGKQIHRHLRKDGFELNEVLGNALVDMYAKCGDLKEAVKLFLKLPGKTVTSWNTMIGGYAQHGMGSNALQQFQRMQEEGLKPDDVTFLNVLYACSHAGLVTEGYRVFLSMCRDFGISPKMFHCVCMVDLFGRSGHLQEAVTFIHEMPLEGDASVWMSLLGACQIHSNVELGRASFDRILKFEPENAAAYVLMSNIYAATGRWEEHAKLRWKMATGGIQKGAGRAWIEADGQVHSFLVPRDPLKTFHLLGLG